MITIKQKISFVIAVFFFITANSKACTEYAHLWKPVNEERSQINSSEAIEYFLRQMIFDKLKIENKKIIIGINPSSNISDKHKKSLSDAVKSINQPNIQYNENATPFAEESNDETLMYLDFVNPEKVTYFWRDENHPPVNLFKYGELETSSIRILVISRKDNSVLLIDEIPFKHLLEHDMIIPSWMSIGGVWIRKLAHQMFNQQDNYEWYITPPRGEEDLNTIPNGIKRIYYSNIPDKNVTLISIPQPEDQISESDSNEE